MFSALTGVFINVGAVVSGSLIGLVFKKGIPEKYAKAITTAIGLCVVFIGISGALRTENGAGADPLILIFSMILGIVIGELLKIDDRLNLLGNKLEKKLSKDSRGDFAKGFVNSTLLFCVGAMAITGSMESALENNHSTLIAKSVLDGINSIVFAANMGIGVIFSSIAILIYQGGIATITYFLGSSFLTPTMNLHLIVTGSLVIMALGFNMLGITKIKVANFLPAIFIAPLIVFLLSLV